MGYQTVTDYHDDRMAVPGHNSNIVFVHQTKESGLHCHDCQWSDGVTYKLTKKDERRMRASWRRHAAFVQGGGVIEHGRPSNVDSGICSCVRCAFEWRMAQREQVSQ